MEHLMTRASESAFVLLTARMERSQADWLSAILVVFGNLTDRRSCDRLVVQVERTGRTEQQKKQNKKNTETKGGDTKW